MVNSMFEQFREYDRRIFWTLAVVGACALLFYVYFVSVAVVSVISRKDAESELGRLTAQVATLESTYVVLDRGIDLELAHTNGFVDVSVPRYISTTDQELAHTASAEMVSD